jgi:drug/metabolite transporter (DMT)-like permease
VSVAALLLVLASALLHASWNLIVKASSDRLTAEWAQALFGAIVFAPFLVVQGIPTEVWPAILISGTVHLTYGLTLVGAYNRGDLSLVYPVARGSAPLLVTLFAALLLDDTPGGGGLIAIGLVVTGVLLIGLRRGSTGIVWALATGALISTYTLIDGAAVRDLNGSFSYTISVFAVNTILHIPIMWALRGRVRIAASMRAEGWRNLLAGTASAGAYMLVLIAARTAPLGLVSAFRETSVLFGAVGAWLILKEPLAGRRLEGAIVITLGLVVLVFSS